MLAMLILCLLVGVMTYYLMFKQGLFSTAIMAFLSLGSSLIAWNYYEFVSSLLGDFGLSGYCSQTVSFLGLFIVSLFILREAFDRLIKGNMKFPFLVERIGAAFFGLLASLVIVGTAAVGFQMLPIPAVLFGFDRCPSLGIADQDKSLFPKADALSAGIVSQASRYGFGGRNIFSQVHPSMLRELYMNRLSLDPASRRESGPDAIQIREARLIDTPPKDVRTGETMDFGHAGSCVAVSFVVKAGTNNKKDRGAKDVDGKTRFTYSNIRLVGFSPGTSETGIAVYPAGVLYPGEVAYQSMGLDSGKTIEGNCQIDLVFEWPVDLKKQPPQFLEFKGTARSQVSRLVSSEASGSLTSESYSGMKTAQESSLLSTDSDAAYPCDRIMVVDRNEAQPIKDMGIPTSARLQKARDDGKLTMAKTESSDAGGYNQVHLLVSGTSKGGNAEDGKGLSVPAGYTLVLVKAHQIDPNRFFPPALVDVMNREYFAVGWSCQSQQDITDNLLEFAYDAKSTVEGFGGDLLMKDQKVTSFNGVFYYLVPHQEPLGIVGCRSLRSRSDRGSFFALAGGVDVLLASR